VYIDIGDDFREVFLIQWDSSERNPVGVVASAHERFTIAIQSARYFADFRP